MAHFAEIDNLQKVINVLVIDDKDTLNLDGDSDEITGAKYLHDSLGGTWLQTSYNTLANQHPDGTPFRKNYAGIGYTYDVDRDAFIPPQQYPSWTLNEDTCQWEAPVPYPEGEAMYNWDEETTSWVEVTGE